MAALRTLFALAALAAAGSAQAQVRPPYAHPTVDPYRYQAEQHRYEIERLRARADEREAFARRSQLETRLNRLEIEAARAPEIASPPAYRPLRSAEEERARRQSATDRRQAVAAGVTQIDAWLDRPDR